MKNVSGSLRAVFPLLVVMVLLAACGGGSATPPTAAPAAEATAAPTGSGKPIAIGSKNFTEAILVAELYAQVLEANGFNVDRKFNLGATSIAQAALQSGDIDLYPEYTSTGLLEVLKQDAIADAAGILAALRKGYEQQYAITWLEPSPFNNSNYLALTRAKAEELGVKTFSDLAAKSANLRFGAPPEFPEREDNKAMLALYGFDPKFAGENFVQLDAGALRYEALTRGDVDVILAFGTDGQIAGLDLVLLADDKNAYPLYQIAPVVRQDALAASPGIADVLNRFAPLLTNEVMAGLNWQVDGPEKREIPDVARAFLTAQGLIK